MDKNTINTQKVIIASLPVFLLTIIVRLIMGYQYIVIFDVAYVLTVFMLLLIHYRNKSQKLFKITYLIYLIFGILMIFLPLLEYKGIIILLLGIFSYFIPIISTVIMFYIKKFM